MAREKELWCFINGANGRRRPSQIPLLVVLCALLVGSLAAAEYDNSYYNYSVWEGKSSPDYQSSNIRMIDGEIVPRIRQETPDKSVVANAQTVSKSGNQTRVTELTEPKNPEVATGDADDTMKPDDVSINKFSDVTLAQNNITKTIYDYHQYYNSTFIVDADICKKYWIDLDNHPELRVNNQLSRGYRRAATVKLKFDFPFYGHNVRNITIATGGFLYTGDYVHSWLAATQYIAPLMANFDSRLSNSSYVKYADNGTAFTVMWENVVLQNKPAAGAFTFQVTLHQNGDIVFVYSVIPLMVEQIEDREHPAKVGLSDGYIMNQTVFFVRRKTIYEYHRVNFNRQNIRNCTVIYLKALPTCLNFNNCRDCLTKVSEFECKWCPELNRCSTGTSRQQQEWLLKGCDVRNIKEADNCPAQSATFKGEEYDHDGHVHPEESITANEMSAKQERPGTSPLESTSNYAVWENNSSPDYQSSNIRLIDGEIVPRIRQETPDKSVVANAQTVSKSDNQTGVTELTEPKNPEVATGDADDTMKLNDVSISKFSDVTLAQNNITKTIYDHHQYYNSTFIVDADICKKYWVDLDNHPELRVNNLLSQSHRRAATVKLKFDFPFYGYNVRNITIATGGFLYTGDYVHSWLAGTQYIAPFMANFDTRMSNSSYVKYADNGTAFTVAWENVVLQDKPTAGAFTFQVTLHQNGDIVFVYSVIPLVEQIEDKEHPVKVGLSDAYIVDRIVFFVRRKTIYEYHRVNFNRQDIMNCTVIYLKALPTCLNFNNCRDCLTKVPEFECKWCPELNKCSTGTSRQQQEWLLKGCDVRNIKEADNCPAQSATFKGEEYDHDGHVHPEESITANEMSAKQERPGTSPLKSTSNYAVWEGNSSPDYQSSNIRLIDGEIVLRIRRETPDKSMVANEQKEPPKDLRKLAAPPQPQPLQESQQQQQPRPPQQEQQQQVPTPQPATNVTKTSSDVSYVTVYSTQRSLIAQHPSETTTAGPMLAVALDLKKKASQSNSDGPNVWANETLAMRNSTGNEKEQPSTVSKSGNQTGVTELTEPKNPETATGDTDDTMKPDDVSISKFNDVSNATLAQNNITKTMYDHHQYYNSTFIVDADICKKYWVDLDNHPELRVNNLLSQSHRRAATVKLKFDFPFYGYNVRNITIATGGFLYTGDYVHSWLAATQYIAPLMANFDTRMSNSSYVKYADNGTAFTVAWENVVLQDKPTAGAFTFQVTLHQNGDIVFVYSVIPLVVEQIEDKEHPVKVGLSDAYIMDRTVFFVRRKTIYEYHRVNFNRQDIMNCTVIYLKALPTCLNFNNCRDCLTKVPEFECKWCPELNKCSTGTSRQRQEWLLKGCDVRNIKEADNCPAQSATFKGEEYDHDGHVHPEESITANEMSAKQERPGTSPLESTTPNKMNMSVSGIIGILTVVVLVLGLAGWGAYAYRNPHSASGQMLIRYRPSQWSWRRGEARYTAATIHM